jgi:hypothetical protein
MKTLFDVQTYQDVARRIASLKADSPRQWGKMSASQMLEHVSRAAEMAAGAKPRQQALLGKAIGWIFKKDFLGEKPFPKSSPTGPDFIIQGEPDFATVQARALALLKQLHELGERGTDGHVHGFFGPLTGVQWGQTQFKHFDHHLRQFGS